MGEGAVAGGGVAVVILTLLVWLVKRLVNAALENMQAMTKAVDANSEATRALANTLNQAVAVRDERDRSMFKQLDKIEAAAGKAAARRHDDTR